MEAHPPGSPGRPGDLRRRAQAQARRPRAGGCSLRRLHHGLGGRPTGWARSSLRVDHPRIGRHRRNAVSASRGPAWRRHLPDRGTTRRRRSPARRSDPRAIRPRPAEPAMTGFPEGSSRDLRAGRRPAHPRRTVGLSRRPGLTPGANRHPAGRVRGPITERSTMREAPREWRGSETYPAERRREPRRDLHDGWRKRSSEPPRSSCISGCLVPGGGIEPPTRGFSIHCSTPELPRHRVPVGPAGPLGGVRPS